MTMSESVVWTDSVLPEAMLFPINVPFGLSEKQLQDDRASQPNPLTTAHGIYITVHGHFYQPPRENPYLDVIECQPSAAPFHDWNERICSECYRPNAFARILNEQGNMVGIVNNYEYLSFNIGPTLMNWLERYDPETYGRIIEADRKSCQRLNGHGNALAQVYNHIIMPLANERDKYTQIRWGKADFRSRFGRDPEGIWLAETAVDYPTLKVLIAEGIKFIVLAPSQAQRCREIPAEKHPHPQWYEVGGSQIDPTRPYRCFLKEETELGKSNEELQNSDYAQERPFIDIFFYDGPISRDMGFDYALFNAQHFAGRLGQAVRGDHRPAQLISVATDGETFGHHKAGTERTLAYAFLEEFPKHGWTVTNFAHYLSLSPPTWEVELKPVTAWSCAHGVGRWQDDCGCAGGGGFHQKWRRPLRDALDWLRDQLVQVYEDMGGKLFKDPWHVRDGYIEVVLDRNPSKVEQFLDRHSLHNLSETERIDALRLLEMQRHALLMYTSCGWFFEELSRLEGVQILRYAARALELAGDVAGLQLEKEFINLLALAPSNLAEYQSGDRVYCQQVQTAQVKFEQIVTQFAIDSLFRGDFNRNDSNRADWSDGETMGNRSLPLAPDTDYPISKLYCYAAHQLDYHYQRIGALTLAVGQVQLVSDITWESRNLVFAVLHLGGWDFHCCIQPFQGRREYSQLKDDLFAALGQASAAAVILAINQHFGNQSYGLKDLLAEERHRIMELLSRETLMRLDQLYTQVYRDNYGILKAFYRDGLSVPQELQVAAEVALSHRAQTCVRSLEQNVTAIATGQESPLVLLSDLMTIATEAEQLHCQLKLPGVTAVLEKLILRSLAYLLQEFDPTTIDTQVQRIEYLIHVGEQLDLLISMDQAQELYLRRFPTHIAPLCLGWLQRQTTIGNNQALIKSLPGAISISEVVELRHIRRLLDLGAMLKVEVSAWLDALTNHPSQN